MTNKPFFWGVGNPEGRGWIFRWAWYPPFVWHLQLANHNITQLGSTNPRKPIQLLNKNSVINDQDIPKIGEVQSFPPECWPFRNHGGSMWNHRGVPVPGMSNLETNLSPKKSGLRSSCIIWDTCGTNTCTIYLSTYLPICLSIDRSIYYNLI